MALATQCPHCYTSFRVANDQLKLYAGLVRCGSCQQTFNGIDHLLTPGQSPKVRPETSTQIVPELSPTNDAHAEHFDDLSSTNRSSEITTDISTIAEQAQQETQEESQPESEIESIAPIDEMTSSEDELTENSHDEKIAAQSSENTVETEVDVEDNFQYEPEDIVVVTSSISDIVDEEPQLHKIEFVDELGASDEPVISMESLTEFKNTLDQIGENLSILEKKTYSSENNHIEIEVETDEISEPAIDDITHTEDENSHQVENSEALSIEVALSIHSDTIENELTSNSIEKNDLVASDAEPNPVTKSRTYDALMQNDAAQENKIDDAFDEVKPQFVIAAENKQKYGKWITALYSFLTVLLIVTALGQLTYYFRDQVFAHVPQARVHLLKACKLLNCSIHLLADKGAVTKESQELVLLSSNPQILTLSVLLQNRSSTAQAWPMIELTLTDNRKKTLLQKVFTPQEYLDNPKDLNRGIAANIEKNIDVNFELGIPKATSYEVKLFYP
jgi:predicted Zn finger-like uncharacterized protein